MPRRLALAALLLAACSGAVTDDHSTTTTGRGTGGTPNPQSVSVLTQHDDNSRAGWNANETLLTTTTVNPRHFGLQFALGVDDQVYAQPLVVGKVAIGDGAHNVVYVATVNNTVYAFDGDDGRLYWKANFTAPGMRPVRGGDMTGACGGGYADFTLNMGIVGTPVIDPATRTIYFVARSTDGTRFVQHLHAVDITSGHEVAGAPVAITATDSGSGDGSVHGVITFDVQRQNQRQGLTLVNGVVYVTWASHCDWRPYHGWILGYDAASLQQRVSWEATPDGSAGGMWESGAGPAADADGNLYVVTGNGTVGANGDPASTRNRGESALKLVPSGGTLRIASWFTPHDYQFLNDNDLDYGGPGAFLIPGTSYFMTGAKDGSLFLLNRDDMGGYAPSTDRARQAIQLASSANLHCQPAYYGGTATSFVYVWSENDALRAIPFDRASGLLDRTGEITFSGVGLTGQTGAMLAVSSNGSTDGSAILWAVYAASGDAEHRTTPGILRAFDATNVQHELWNSQQNGQRDNPGEFAKFAAPTVANGHVYLPTFGNQVVVYGVLP